MERFLVATPSRNGYRSFEPRLLQQIKNLKAESQEKIERLRAAIGRSPKRSARGHSVALNISSRSLGRVLHSGLLFHPYQLHTVRELSDRDFASRSAFCEQFFCLSERTLRCYSSGDVR
jgi:hypothetical protein